MLTRKIKRSIVRFPFLLVFVTALLLNTFFANDLDAQRFGRRATSKLSSSIGKGFRIKGKGKVNRIFKKDQIGVYHNVHASNNSYIGKGTPLRAATSAKEKAIKNNDPLHSTTFYPTRNKKDAFLLEHKLIQKHGGPGSPNLYNKINSPGKKIWGKRRKGLRPKR